MSKQSTSFEIGFALGSVVREFRRALSRPPVVVQAPLRRAWWASSSASTAC